MKKKTILSNHLKLNDKKKESIKNKVCSFIVMKVDVDAILGV